MATGSTSILPSGQGGSPRGLPNEDPSHLTEGCRLLRERIEDWQTSQTKVLAQQAEDAVRRRTLELSAAQREKTVREEAWESVKTELTTSKASLETARKKWEEAVEKQEAAVRALEQASKECVDKGALAAQAESKQTEFLSRSAEQLLLLAEQFEGKPTQILEDLGKWHGDTKAELAKVSAEAAEALKAAEAANERMTEAERSLEEAMPQLERNIQLTQEALDEAQASVGVIQRREQDASSAFQNAVNQVPKVQASLDEAHHRRDEMVAEGEHLANVVDLLQNSLKALSNLRPRNRPLHDLGTEEEMGADI